MLVVGSGDLLINKSEHNSQKSPKHNLNVDSTSPKVLKGAWTHCPDEKSLVNVIKRLRICRVLCDEVNIIPLTPLIMF